MAANCLTAERRNAALCALLGARTIADAAAKYGVCERTMGRYLADPEFRADLDAMRCEAREYSVHSLVECWFASRRELVKILDDPTARASDKIAAAGKLLDVSQQADRDALGRRIAILEQLARVSDEPIPE